MKVVAADTEARGLDWWDPAHRAFLATWTDEHGSNAAWEDDAAALARFLDALRSAGVLVFHNAPYDIHQIRETWGFDCLTDTKAVIVDTNILARVVVPERGMDGSGYKLKDLGVTFVDPNAKDTEGIIDELAKSIGVKLKSTGGYYEVARAYPKEMEDYARMDTDLTYALYFKLIAKLEGRLHDVWDLEREVQPHLIRAEQRGVAIDQRYVTPLKEEYEAKAKESGDLVVAELGEEALGGPAKLAAALVKYGVPLHRKTDTGQLAVNKFALAEFEEDFPVLKALGEWTIADKFLSTFIGPMVDRDVVHTSIWQLGAWTGRMSSSRPNLQNIPVRAGSECRKMFVPRPGNVFVVCDFDSIELRLLAYYLNDEGFKEKIRRGDDVFAELAALLAQTKGYGAEHGTEPDCFRKGAPGEKYRGNAKNATYAITYGAGGAKIGDMLGTDPGKPWGPNDYMVQKGYAKAGDPSHEEARAIIRTVKSWLPGYGKLVNKRIRTKVETLGHVNTIMGRRQPVSRDKAYVGLNALIQGSAAEIMKRAIVDVAPFLDELDAHMVLFVHDEIVVEAPEEHAEIVLATLEDAMRAAYPLDPPLAVSGTIARNSYAEGK